MATPETTIPTRPSTSAKNLAAALALVAGISGCAAPVQTQTRDTNSQSSQAVQDTREAYHDSVGLVVVWLAATMQAAESGRCERAKEIKADHVDPELEAVQRQLALIREYAEAHVNTDAKRLEDLDFMRIMVGMNLSLRCGGANDVSPSEQPKSTKRPGNDEASKCHRAINMALFTTATDLERLETHRFECQDGVARLGFLQGLRNNAQESCRGLGQSDSKIAARRITLLDQIMIPVKTALNRTCSI